MFPDVRKAGIYARISSDREGDGLGVRRQVEDCEELAARRGWRVVDRYVDNDVSAYSGSLRPEYERMLDDLAGGVIDAVVVWHLDRLHRQPRELEEFFEACDRAGSPELASVSGDVDLATHDGRFTARILGAVARKESDDKSRRIKRKAAELAKAGAVCSGGSRAYGYERGGMVVRASEAEVIRECVRRFLAGESLRSLCADLNERGVRTATGGEWKTQVLRRMLRSGRISGQREHHGEIVARGTWPAIITPKQTAQVRAIMDDPSRRTNHTSRRYLLTRLLRCKRCGAVMVARPREDGRRRYICASGPNFSGCGKTYIVADELEQFVVEAVLYRLDSPELAEAMNGSRQDADDGAQLEADQAGAQLEELARAYADRAISLPEWLTARQPIEQRMEAARRRLARTGRESALNGHVGNASELRRVWPTLPLTRQQAIVAAVLEYVEVGPARRGVNRFDDSRLAAVWRV